MQEEDKYWILISRYLSNELSDTETDELLAWVNENQEHTELLQQMQNAWEQSNNYLQNATQEIDADEAWKSVEQRIFASQQPVKVKRLKPLKWMSIAATLLLLAGLSWFSFNYYQQNLPIVFANRLDTKQQLLLPDGSKVWLNSGSQISYKKGLNTLKLREVDLKGEGFFEVTKNSKRPFLVHTARLVVKVLGTVFNVKAYNNDKTVETTLLKGKVQVELKNNPEKKIILLPNEKLIVVNNREPKSVKSKEGKIEYQVTELPDVKPDEVKETAWVDNRILFTNEMFEDVAAQIERKYNVQVVFEDRALRTEQISGLLDKETLKEALGIIELTTPFNFRVDGQTVYLSKKDK